MIYQVHPLLLDVSKTSLIIYYMMEIFLLKSDIIPSQTCANTSCILGFTSLSIIISFIV